MAATETCSLHQCSWLGTLKIKDIRKPETTTDTFTFDRKPLFKSNVPRDDACAKAKRPSILIDLIVSAFNACRIGPNLKIEICLQSLAQKPECCLQSDVLYAEMRRGETHFTQQRHEPSSNVGRPFLLHVCVNRNQVRE